MNQAELNKTFTFAKELCLEAGKKLLNYSKKINKLEINHKKGMGIATSADLAVENFLISKIKKKFPEHKFIAEETIGPSEFKKTYKDFNEETFWIIDPLDGTNNFVTGFPYYSVCMALSHKGKIVMGLVYRPENGDFFFAYDGKGAYFQNIKQNARPKKMGTVKAKKELSECIFITEVFPKGSGVSRKQGYQRYRNVLNTSRSLRRLGSAALDMCYVANGTFDGFWQSKIYPWDFCAAYKICELSNTKVTDLLGQKFNPLQSSVLVARPAIHNKLSQALHKK